MERKSGILSRWALSVAVFLSFSALADDTEIFFSSENVSEINQPNVLFIMDTSGSMGEYVTSKAEYDPGTNYCAMSGVSCNDRVYVYNTNYSYQGFSIDSSRNNCKAMTDFLAANPDRPIYEGNDKRVGQWREWIINYFGFTWDISRWENVSNSSRSVECQEDAGVHGETDSSTERYAADGSNGPYTSSSSQQINWSGISDRIYVSSNYHYYLINAESVTDRKINIVKDAASNLVNSFSGLNFGLMRFNYSEGGYVVQHFADVETNRSSILTSISTLNANGWTPLNETLWEAHKYFSGGSIEYGGSSVAAAKDGSNYNSPIDDTACPANYIVYLTDGEPTQDGGRDTTVSNLTSYCDHSDYATSPNGTCLDELAGYMANYDYVDAQDGTQGVSSYFIGFDTDLELLQQAATNGNGQYINANSADELRDAFNQIIFDILTKSTTFTAPAVSVNAYNSLQHRNELYYAIFKPSTSPRWYGNAKKYRIDSSGDIRDANGLAAIEESTGYFKTGAKSYWSDLVDGDDVTAGGVAGELSASRNVYTVSGDPSGSNISLNTAVNRIAVDNDLITNLHYGLAASATTTEREELINWILGADVLDEDGDNNVTEPNHFMADPLHNRPIVVTYDDDPNATPVVLDDTLFVMSNDGAFRAVDTSDGSEIFAFIPQDILKNQIEYFANNQDGVRRYGLDGPITIWQSESNDADVRVEAADGDHVYAYFGMRRGGRNLYALDVTNRSSPVLKWTIFGGNAGFKDLGQTWSRPVHTQVNWNCDGSGANCTLKDVLIFGGGYDTVHDDAVTPTTGDKGAAIYMVDANTGALLWSAGNNSDNVSGDDVHDLPLDINNSIPGDVTVSDLNGDGAADILFASDILGHIWRIDINSQSQSASDFATGSAIADLSGTGSQFRRFYVGPNVSLSLKRGQAPFFVVTIGSGWTAHPKNTDISDRLYALYEYDVYAPPRDAGGDITYPAAVTNSDLFDASAADAVAGPAINANGFYKDADASIGEKFIRPSLTMFGVTVYTSYTATSGAVSTTCGVGHLGGGRLYSMDFVTGKSKYTGQYYNLNHPGIPPQPVVLFIPSESGGPTQPILCVGTECFGTDDDQNPWDEISSKVLYWRENLQ